MSGEAPADYRITGEIVEGGMEKVYQATDTKPGREFTKDCSYQRLFRTKIQYVAESCPQSQCLDTATNTLLLFGFRRFLCIKRHTNDRRIYGENIKGKFDE
jgi:hypothetical protein